MNKIRIESPEVQGFEKEHTAAVRRLGTGVYGASEK